LARQPDVTKLEAFKLRLNAEFLDAACRRPQYRRRADVGEVAVAIVERPAVERANLGEQLLDVRQPFQRSNQVGAFAGLERIRVADDKVAAHAGAEVDDDVDIAAPDPLDHLAVPVGMPAALAGLRIADVDVGDGGAGPGRLDDGVGDLPGRDRDGRVLADRVARAGDRAGHDDLRLQTEFTSPPCGLSGCRTILQSLRRPDHQCNRPRSARAYGMAGVAGGGPPATRGLGFSCA